MKLYLTLLVFISLFLPSRSKADSVSTIDITKAVVSIGLNFGDGDNVLSSMSGRPLVSISGEGGSSCDFCFAGQFFLPGQSVSASVSYLEPFAFVISAQIGGITYVDGQLSFGSTLITSGWITFPSGKILPPVFTAILPASFANFHGDFEQTGQLITVVMPPGKLELTFDLVPAQNGSPAYYEYSGGEFVTTPEPVPMLLFGTGLVAIGFVRFFRLSNPSQK